MRLKSHVVRRDLAKDLRELAQVLRKIPESIPDVTPVFGASDECGSECGADFRYDLSGLLFRIGTRKMKPIPTALSNVTVKLSLSVFGPCAPTLPEEEDPLHHLEFNIVISGDHSVDDDRKRVHWAWHLDRNVGNEGDLSSYIHPYYHFQAGGRNLDREGSFGDALIIAAPRIAHPPMDAPLGIDFVLTNFLEDSVIRDLRGDSVYRRIMRASQERFWKPYIQTLNRAWSIETSQWHSGLLFPQLFKDRPEAARSS